MARPRAPTSASGPAGAPVGAFAFGKDNAGLLDAVNQALRRYLGSADHRARMATYGFTSAEIDGVLPDPRPKSPPKSRT